MVSRGLNPRRLSVTAGLNPTAVRDIFEGRTQCPRYSTVQKLAAVLGVTPAELMEGSVPVVGESPSTTAAVALPNRSPLAASGPEATDGRLIDALAEGLQTLLEAYKKGDITGEDFLTCLDSVRLGEPLPGLLVSSTPQARA